MCVAASSAGMSSSAILILAIDSVNLPMAPTPVMPSRPAMTAMSFTSPRLTPAIVVAIDWSLPLSASSSTPVRPVVLRSCE
jgi:hypothetical protein